MRLWSLHPAYLDARGLVAAWREGLLARAVVRGVTRGYRSHPQLIRFRNHPAPRSAINRYLRGLADEAARRGYRFDRSLLGPVRNMTRVPVTNGQLRFELKHLLRKIRARAPAELARLPDGPRVRAHPLFRAQAGGIADWERLR